MFAHITSLALVDAVNPCTLAVQALLLSAIVLTKGRKQGVIAGALFASTIYIMYLLYGLGILQVIYLTGLQDVLELILKGLLLLMIALELNAYFNYRPGMISMEMPMFLRPFVKKTVNAIDNPLMSVPIAAICSILLLPCSSGPYVAALMILEQYKVALKLAYLLYYCALFVLPMFLITALVGIGTSPKKVMEWRNNHVKELHLLSGLLLLSVLLLL